MANLYRQNSQLDNAIRNINRKLQSAAKTFGVQSSIYQAYASRVQAALGMYTGTKGKGSKAQQVDLVQTMPNGEIKVLRTAQIIQTAQSKATNRKVAGRTIQTPAGLSFMQKGQSAVDSVLQYMKERTIPKEKKRVTEYIEQTMRPKSIPSPEIMSDLLRKQKDDYRKAEYVDYLSAKKDMRAVAAKMAAFESNFGAILDYIYDYLHHLDTLVSGKAAEATSIMRRLSSKKTYADLRRVVQLAMEIHEIAQSEGYPDSAYPAVFDDPNVDQPEDII